MYDDVLGVILAGGRSTRYGSPKALACVGGVRIIDRVQNAMAQVTRDVVLIANDPALAATAGLRWRPDIHPDAGALGGIHAALEWAADESRLAILAAACDMPFLSISLLHALAGRGMRADGAAGADAVVAESGGRRGVEPLCAFYSVRCLDAIARAIRAGDRRMIGFYDDVRVERIPLEEVETFGDVRELFLNVNTPEDREQAERINAIRG